MIALANIMQAIGEILMILINTMVILLIARVIISWVSADPFNPIVRFIIAATDPILKPLRRYIPPIGGAIDFTPLIALLILFFLRTALALTIIEYAHDIKMRGQIMGG